LQKHKYPFLEAFLKDSPPDDFTLIFTGLDSYGGKIELYRFHKNMKSFANNR